MNIPVKITVGCRVSVMPNKNSFAQYEGIVEAVYTDSYDVLINGNSRNLHTTQIMAFTFGGVWMPNREFPDTW
ncbi:MAG: hypothetical protein KAR20_02700 [Candidatus Heimdallarchaeota archaeon]|nr:hypothetical protein [Candidatus Heimdallarchaeota archaeon]